MARCLRLLRAQPAQGSHSTNNKFRTTCCNCRRVVACGAERSEAASRGSSKAASPAVRPKLVSLRRFHFCEICATGSGIIECNTCQGSGTVNTKPGGGGVAFFIGMARCKLCNGLGVTSCPMCAGYEDRMPPPNPDGGLTKDTMGASTYELDSEELDLATLTSLFGLGRMEPHGAWCWGEDISGSLGGGWLG